jgi:ribulose-5-phosphate 4-epimerase/fuculose-1-phosphate aldolase
MAVMHGFNEGIFNHFTLRVPGSNDRYYQIPFGHHWSEVNASCFMEVGYDGTRLAGEGEIERSAYCIHAPMHRALPAAAAVFHTHMPFASALSRLEDPRILPIGQTEFGTMMHTAYDMTYTVLMMANHGVVTVGATVAEAYDRLYYVERVAQVQLYAMWTNKPLKHLPQEVVDHTISSFKASGQKYGGRSNADWHFAALKRILDRKEPDYKE